MSQHHIIRFSIDLTYDQYLKVYQGIAKTITVISDDGRRIIFPAGNIQSFLTKQGISGYFEMEFTPQNKFVGIKKIR
jgi:UDP-2,3-diacylglucosamine pyrophosphatase LpxH